MLPSIEEAFDTKILMQTIDHDNLNDTIELILKDKEPNELLNILTKDKRLLVDSKWGSCGYCSATFSTFYSKCRTKIGYLLITSELLPG